MLSQQRPRPNDFTIVAGNAVVGGLTAAIGAAASDRPLLRAMITGLVGGATHGTAKVLVPRAGFPGVALSAVGTSIVANAGRAAAPLDKIVLPLGPARVRITTVEPRRITVAVNAYETATLVARAARPGLRVDWSRSLHSGTVVLRTSRALMVGGNKRAAGLTTGSIITLSDLAWNQHRTFTHERIHVLQRWFLEETWGRPVETRARQGTAALRWIPGWLDLGIVTPALLFVERRALGPSAPMRTVLELEAEALEVRPRR